MKNITAITALLLCVGCSDYNYITGPTDNNDLGPVSFATDISSISNTVVSDDVDVVLNVTAGSKYSLYLENIVGDISYRHGFTAVHPNTVVTLNLIEVANGDYQLILMDTKGKEDKVPLIIKH